MRESRGVYTLSPAHAEAVRHLATDPEVAAVMGIPHPPSESAVGDYVAARLQARAEGRAYTFVLTDSEQALGLCGLSGVGEEEAPRLVVAVGRPHRDAGSGIFAATRMLELAFQNLQLDRVVSHASDTDAACHRMLQRLGFEPRPANAPGGPAPRQAEYELTRRRWQDARERPALAALHPSLRPILAAELAAGNELAEMSTGWPDADSVFVRLRDPFRTRPDALPNGVEYHEPNDPHWWRADYSSSTPRHVLAW